MRSGLGAVLFMCLFAVLSTSRADLNAGLVAYYPFDGNANDASGNGNDGTVHGATLAMDRFGTLSSAYSFDGVSSRIFITDSPSLSVTNSVTLAAFINASQQQNEHAAWLIFRGDDRNALDPYSLGLIDGTNLLFLIDDDKYNSVSLQAPIAPTEWHQVVGTLDGISGQMKLFIDGVVVASTNTAVRPFGLLTGPQPGLGLGHLQSSDPSFKGCFKGVLDEVRIYNRALFTSEISQLYTNTPVPFVSLSPIVSNVRASQRAQTNLVDIFYDLSATNNGPFSVFVAVSTNNGSTYDLPASSFTGNGFGSAVTVGTRKQVVWNAGADWLGQYSSAVRFKVMAFDSFTVSISPTGGTFNLNTFYAWNALVSGGSPPYSYLWTGTSASGSFSSTNAVFQKMFTTIGSKKFIVTVTDSHGAVAVSSTNSIVVVEGGGGGGEL